MAAFTIRLYRGADRLHCVEQPSGQHGIMLRLFLTIPAFGYRSYPAPGGSEGGVLISVEPQATCVCCPSRILLRHPLVYVLFAYWGDSRRSSEGCLSWVWCDWQCYVCIALFILILWVVSLLTLSSFSVLFLSKIGFGHWKMTPQVAFWTMLFLNRFIKHASFASICC